MTDDVLYRRAPSRWRTFKYHIGRAFRALLGIKGKRFE